MTQVIGLASKYVPLLDEVYKQASKTSILDASSDLVREGMTANSIYIPDITLQGLGDYSATAGFVAGEATFTWRQHTFSQDRGRTFTIDAVENMETVDTAFAAVASQFIRAYVVPEVDAYRIAKLATAAIGNSMTAGAALDSTTALQAIDTGLAALSDNEVSVENCIIYVTPNLMKLLKNSNALTRMQVVDGPRNVNREILTLDGVRIEMVPKTRMYSQITLLDGAGDEVAGGYAKTVSTGKDLNFLIVDPAACFGITKTALPRIFSPEENQTAHAWKFDYRLYHDLFVSTAKLGGIYAHTTT